MSANTTKKKCAAPVHINVTCGYTLVPLCVQVNGFGIVESVLSIAILAQRFRLTLPEGTEVKHECRLTLRPKGSLPMTLEKRVKSPQSTD